jgi:hypothetical protein
MLYLARHVQNCITAAQTAGPKKLSSILPMPYEELLEICLHLVSVATAQRSQNSQAT